MMSGRGRGRGRGAAPSGPRPVARDDDGNVVNIEAKPEGAPPTGPPPLYPEKELPELPNAVELDDLAQFVKDYRHINHQYQHSPFYLKGKDGGRPAAASTATLASVVTLDPEYFPSELYSEHLKSRGNSQAAQAAYWSGHRQQRQQTDDADDLTLGRLDELAKKESQRNGGVKNTSGGEALNEAEEEEEEPDDAEADAVDDEDFLGDEEDPYQQYDDDDGYDDPDDDDGGNEATYY